MLMHNLVIGEFQRYSGRCGKRATCSHFPQICAFKNGIHIHTFLRKKYPPYAPKFSSEMMSLMTSSGTLPHILSFTTSAKVAEIDISSSVITLHFFPCWLLFGSAMEQEHYYLCLYSISSVSKFDFGHVSTTILHIFSSFPIVHNRLTRYDAECIVETLEPS